MVYDVSPGQPVTPTLTFFDADGGPIESGITGTMTLYGPASADALDGPETLVHRGGGRWGPTFGGDLTTARGTYRWVTSAISGAATLAAQSGTFIVGLGNQSTLRELLTSVRRSLRDGWTGTTSGSGNGGGTTLVASAFAYGSNNRWGASEIFFFEPQVVTDANPVRVQSFVASSGTFTFTPAISATIANLDFIIGDREGQGWAHAEVLDAIQTAAKRLAPVRRVADRVSLSLVSDRHLYTLPSDWIALDGVDYLAPGSADEWKTIAAAYLNRRHVGSDGVFGIDNSQAWLAGYALRLRGRAAPMVPEAMGGYVHGDGPAIRDDAIYELLLMSDKAPDRQRAAGMQPAVMRARAAAALGRLG